MTKIPAINTIVLHRHTVVLRLTKHLTKPHLVLSTSITIGRYQQKGRKRNVRKKILPIRKRKDFENVKFKLLKKK